MITQALTLTLWLAVVVSAILLALSLPLAYWLAFSHRRWKFLIEAIVSLPIVLPPTVLGFYLLVAIGPRSPIGRWYQTLTGHSLAFTFEGLVVGSVLYSLPFAVQPMAASFSSIDSRLLDASALLGASPWRTFWRIVGIARGIGEFRFKFCAYPRRVRGCADDWRQHPRRDANCFHPHLRPGAVP
jgi:molybdate transport system permease protein